MEEARHEPGARTRLRSRRRFGAAHWRVQLLLHHAGRPDHGSLRARPDSTRHGACWRVADASHARGARVGSVFSFLLRKRYEVRLDFSGSSGDLNARSSLWNWRALKAFSAGWPNKNSEDVQLDAEIFLGIFLYRLHQRRSFCNHLVGVVVEGFVFEELAGRPLARFQF